MNISMPIRHGVFVARFSALADERERLTRSQVFTRIAAALDPDGRFASQLRYPAEAGDLSSTRESRELSSPD